MEFGPRSGFRLERIFVEQYLGSPKETGIFILMIMLGTMMGHICVRRLEVGLLPTSYCHGEKYLMCLELLRSHGHMPESKESQTVV